MSKARNFRITVMELGSGWAAVMIADYEDMGWGPDVVQTGFGRYTTRDEAEQEALDWSQMEEVPLEI